MSVVAEEAELEALLHEWLERERETPGHGQMLTANGQGEMLTAVSKLWEEAQVQRRSRLRSPSHRQAPQFMLDLFEALEEANGTSTHHASLLQGNVVRSFQDKGEPSGAFHYFHISSVGKNENVLRAEFRWYRRKHPPSLGASYAHHFYKVDLYEVLDSKVHPWRGTLITSRLLPAHTQGWESFNVTQTVCRWVLDGSSNNGLLLVKSSPSGFWVESGPATRGTSSVETNPTQGTSSVETNPTRVTSNADAPATRVTSNADAPSTRITSNASAKSTQGVVGGAYLVVFSDDRRKAVLDGDEMKPLQTSLSGSTRNQQRRRRRNAQLLSGPLGASDGCHRRSLYVDFQKMGWSSWIISPRGYNAYHCQGSCPFPLSESLRASNHATVQSIVHALRLSRDVSDPCCVPDSLDPISLLFFDDQDNVVLKQYQDMVAHSCGCR